MFLPVKRAFVLVKDGRINGLAGHYDKTEHQKEFFFSESIIIDTISFFYLVSNDFEWRQYSDLRDLKIGATLGYDYGGEFKQAEEKKIINVQKTTKNIQNFQKLLLKRIDLFPMSTLPGYVLLYKNFDQSEIRRITNHSKPVRSTHIYLILPKSDPNSLKRMTFFNETLKTLKKNGRYDQYFNESLDYFRNNFVNQPKQYETKIKRRAK